MLLGSRWSRTNLSYTSFLGIAIVFTGDFLLYPSNFHSLTRCRLIPFTPARMKSMNNPEEYVIIMAKILDLTIPDRYLNSVVENWQRLQEIASLVTEFPLEDDGESALSFEP